MVSDSTSDPIRIVKGGRSQNLMHKSIRNAPIPRSLMTLADDETFSLGGVEDGVICVTVGDHTAFFRIVGEEQSSTYVGGASSDYFASSDTDAKFCFYYDESSKAMIFKNRTGGTVTFEFARIY